MSKGANKTVGGISSLGLILMSKGAKKTKGEKGSETTQRG